MAAHLEHASTITADTTEPPGEAAAFHYLDDLELPVTIELGRTEITVAEALALDEGSVLQLNRSVNDPVDVYVKDRLVARGELLVLDGKFCVRITEILNGAVNEVAR